MDEFATLKRTTPHTQEASAAVVGSAAIAAVEVVSTAIAADVEDLRARSDAVWGRVYALSMRAAGLALNGDALPKMEQQSSVVVADAETETLKTATVAEAGRKSPKKLKKPPLKPEELPLGVHFGYVY